MAVKDLQELVLRAQSGDKQALESICLQLQHKVREEISSVVRDADLVEELSQETYVKFIKGIQNIKEPIKVKGFVTKIVLFVINDYFHKHYQWKDVIIWDEEIEQKHAPAKGRGLENDETLINKVAIDEAIRVLPTELDKQLMKLKLLGHRYKEIAVEMAISEDAARTRFKRAVDYLKRKFRHQT